MKSKELIAIFDICTKIMSYYKDKDILFILKDILSILEERAYSNNTASAENAKITDTKDLGSSYDYENMAKNIAGLSLEELKILLEDTGKFPNVESLKQFANQFGVKAQARASRVNIIHTIIKSVERSRIDQTISSRLDK
jgi:hypothetical protein